MKSKLTSLLCLFLLFPMMSVMGANSFTVKGTVTDKGGEPLVGVSVIVKGTSFGAQTNVDGEFSLNASQGNVLRFSYIGYTPVEYTVKGQEPITIVMEEEATALEEVVVTALGIKRSEKALSYNVQKLDGSAVTGIKETNFVNSLNGKVAGININKSSAGVGGAARVVLRGAKSIEGDNNALYVIDGIPMFNTNMGNTGSGIMGESRTNSEGIADLNPEDIESISVLSGPSAAALYGSSAANGVILITTKKGVEGKFSATVSSTSMCSKAYMTPKFQNTYGNVVGSYESWGSKLATPTSFDPVDDFLQTGTNFINSVTINTGTRTNQTFASLASTNAEGIVPNNTYDRLNFSIRNTSKFLDDKLQLDLGASYINQRDKNMVSQGYYWNPIVQTYLFPRGENFNDIKTFERYNTSRNFATQYWPVQDGVYALQNPYWEAYRNPATNKKRRYMFNAGLTYNITDWLNVTARYHLDDTNSKFERKLYASTVLLHAKSEKGGYEFSNYTEQQQYADVIANLNKSFGEFSIAANVGYSYSDYRNEIRGEKGRFSALPTSSLPTISTPQDVR